MLYPYHTTTTNSTNRHELINQVIRGIRQSLWTESLHSTNWLRYRYDIATNIRENRFDSAWIVGMSSRIHYDNQIILKKYDTI